MHLVDRHGLASPVGFGALLHVLGVSPFERLRVRNDRGCARPQFRPLRERVRLLAGLDEAAIERARRRIRLTPGARTFVATLQRLGAKVAIISGGFTPFTDWLRSALQLDHAFANVLELRDGVLTGEVLGPVVDRARKAELLVEIAADEGIPLTQTVAIGDGANDLDMLAVAGLGIAFNAKPVVRRQVGTTVSVPYLDAILFMLGIRGRDVDRAE